MTDKQKTIRENSRKVLGEWFAESLKKQVAISYKFFRAFGLPAWVAIDCARQVVTKELNKFAKQNFYGRSPF